MTFIEIFLLIIIGVSITNIIVNASVLETARNFLFKRFRISEGLLSCMLCSGFWVGLFLGFTSFREIGILFSGFIVSLFSHIYSLVINLASIIEIEEDSEDEEIE